MAVRWWVRGVGVIYLALGVACLCILETTQLSMLVPEFDGPLGGYGWRGLMDYLVMLGLEELIVGAALMIASSVRRWSEALVDVVCGVSIIRGIGHHVYLISRGYSIVGNILFIALHLVIVVTGLLLVWRARRDGESDAPRGAQVRRLEDSRSPRR